MRRVGFSRKFEFGLNAHSVELGLVAHSVELGLVAHSVELGLSFRDLSFHYDGKSNKRRQAQREKPPEQAAA